MTAKTSIEWTDATWNPLRGCTRKSPECINCYAEIMAARFSGPGDWGEGFAHRVGGDHRWTGKVALIPELLDLPLKWNRPRKIFANSTSDLFHEALPDAAIDEVVAVIAQAATRRGHVFQVLTKRADRMRDYWAGVMAGRLVAGYIRLRRPLPNLWLGVSIGSQEYAEERVPALMETPAALRFVSCEPLLGPVDLRPWLLDRRVSRGDDLWGLDWVIVGGESGPGARPMHPAWARSLRDQCTGCAAFFFKQWGEWHPNSQALKGDAGFTRLGKGRSGALLDGRLHREFPKADFPPAAGA